MSEASLRYFFEAARYGSMRAAAEKLGVAVSSVSRQIAQLELDMGISLIEHGRRTIKLTEAGELTLDYYRKHLGQREDFESRLADLKGLRAGKVDVAVDDVFASTAMPATLMGFMAKFSTLMVAVRSLGIRQLVEAVAEDDVHLGVGFNVPEDPRLRVRSAVSAPLCLVIGRGHPLANRYRVQFSDLADVRLALTDGAFEIEPLLRTVERHEGVALCPALMTNSIPLIRSMILEGEYATILPEFAVARDVEERAIACIPFVDPLLSSTAISLVCRLGRQMPRAGAQLMMAFEGELSRRQPQEQLRAG